MKALNSYYKVVLFSFFSLFSTSNFAQDPPKMEWDKISNDDLRMTHWATDSTAEAAILGDFGQLFMDEVKGYTGYNLSHHKRIKIFKKSAFERANVRIVYRSKDDYEYIFKIKAQTILPNGRRIPVEPKGFVLEKLNDNASVQKITFPSVTEGVVLEYEYVIVSKNLFELKPWEFQDDIPLRHSVLHLNIESRFSYTYLFQGKDFIKQTEIFYDKKSDGNYGTVPDRTRFSFFANNLPALKKEAYVSSVSNYITKISFQLVEYFDRQGGKQKILPTWEKTVIELLDDDSFGKTFLKKSKYDEVWEKIKPLIAPTDSAMKKINTIYDWVNDNLEWDENLWFYASKSPNEILKKRKGNSADINFTLIALLREAGLDANPIILSSRENGKPFIEYPFLRQYDHIIAHVDLNGKIMLLDCGNKHRPPGIIRVAALNDRGYLIKKKDHKWIDIAASLSSQISIANMELTEEGKLNGIITYQFKGNMAAEKRYEANDDETGDKLKEVIEKRLPDWVIDSVGFKFLKNSREPFQETLKLSVNNVGQVNDDIIYFKPTLQSGWEKNPFKMPKRYYPVEFPYPTNEQFILNLKIPAGYKVEEMPKPINLAMPPDDGRFQYLISEKDNLINLVVKINLKKTVFSTESYDYLKRFFDDIAAKLDEQIVLKKVSK